MSVRTKTNQSQGTGRRARKRKVIVAKARAAYEKADTELTLHANDASAITHDGATQAH